MLEVNHRLGDIKCLQFQHVEFIGFISYSRKILEISIEMYFSHVGREEETR